MWLGKQAIVPNELIIKALHVSSTEKSCNWFSSYPNKSFYQVNIISNTAQLRTKNETYYISDFCALSHLDGLPWSILPYRGIRISFPR